MPIYRYVANTDGCETCAPVLEVVQAMSDPPLEKCSDCGAALHRAPTGFGVARGRGDVLSKSNLEKNGFTQYKRIGKGEYEKTAGAGPSILTAD